MFFRYEGLKECHSKEQHFLGHVLTKNDEEEVGLEDDSDCSDEEADHQVRLLRLRKGQLES